MRSLDLAHRKNALAQQEVASARNNQARLENQVYELDQKLTEARREAQRLSRAKKDFDRQIEQNNANFERERALWAERESELVRSVKFATRPLVVQAPAKEREASTSSKEVDVVPPVVQQQIAEINAAHTRALRAQENIVTELRKQVLNMNQDLIERQRNFTLKESELQAQIAQAQELNRGLMEENESYQMLLHEKSMNGEFMQTSIMKNTGYNDDPSATPLATHSNGSINLAEELGKAFDRSPVPNSEKSIEEEVKQLRESNTALGLYISRILSRIMENPHLQAVLAADYSPRRASIPASSPALISQGNKSNSSLNNVVNTTPETESSTKPEGRARSRSLFGGGSIFSSRSKPVPAPVTNSGKSSTRNSSEDDAASGTSTGVTSFHDGHVLEDSPRTSNSSSEFRVVTNDLPRPAEYEQLTTFDQPFTRKQLQRHASMSSAAGQDRHQRRQTIGGAGSFQVNGSGSGHGRYGSDSSALTASQGRWSVMSKSKNNLTIMAPMPEQQSTITTLMETSPIAERPDSESMDSMRSPTLSISISESSASTSSAGVATPTTPVTTEGGMLKKMRRWSLFGASNPNATTTTTTTPTAIEPVKEGDDVQLTSTPILEEPAAVHA
ncbi:hypothetical protein BG015_002280 [Linnemannia schmuckeri]|uniref:Uncharacterized protein n=1 Tax=Linnemannia schmuckeri TaxID=64567 RepID=A0A9P5RS72_9FUNG|nr:hypothetical protein BG015_002280 [Linnemannia schmuckeri]